MKKFLILFSLIVSIFSFAGSAKASWQTLGTVGFSAGTANEISMAIDSNGVQYVAYSDGSNGFKLTVMKYSGGAWVTVGTVGFSAGTAHYISTAIDSTDTPYVAYSDGSNFNKATVKKWNGSAWVDVGSPDFSDGGAYVESIAIDSNDLPYVVYTDSANAFKATVMKFDGASWGAVGSAGFSADEVDYVSIALDSNDVPYVAYQDVGNSRKATVVKWNGVDAWVEVGSGGFSTGTAQYTTLALDSNDVPYVAYRDVANSNKATVKKWNGVDTWDELGSGGLSSGGAHYLSLKIDGDDSPYIAYMDVANNNKATVKKWNGSSWDVVGVVGFSASEADFTSLALDLNDVPHLAYSDIFNDSKATVKVFGSTLYFNHAVDSNWSNLNNWWKDAGFSVPATHLPTSIDDVVITQDVLSKDVFPALANTLTVGSDIEFDIPIIVTNGAFFSGSSFLQVDGNITGNASFKGTSQNHSTVHGDACFASTATNSGTVTGSTTVCHLYFNAAADLDWNNLNNWWTDSGFTVPATSVPDSSDDVVVEGTVFSNSGTDNPSINTLNVDGDDAHIYIHLTVLNGADFYNSNSIQPAGVITGNVTFHDTGHNEGTVDGDATFDDASHNFGTVDGDAFFNDIGFNDNGGEVTGIAKFNYAHNGIITIADGGIWGRGTAGSIVGDDDLPLTFWIFNGESGNTYNDGNIDGDVVFNDASFNNFSNNLTMINGNVTFNGTSANNADITGDVTFNDLSANYELGVINGNACFATTAQNLGTVTGTVSVCSSGGPTPHTTHRSGSTPDSIKYFQAQNLIIPPSDSTSSQVGCTSSYKFSPTTGKPCSNTTSPTPPITSPSTSCNIIFTLKQGMKGAEVKCLQSKLNITSDGAFGPKTKLSVISFQKLHLLTSDGVVGPKTRAILMSN